MMRGPTFIEAVGMTGAGKTSQNLIQIRPKQIHPIPKLKTYKIVRIIREEFQVTAQNKDEAKLNIKNPHTVTVVRETIKLYKS